MANKELKQIVGAGTPTYEEYFSKLFQIRDSLHFTHLEQRTESFAQHIALEEIYKGILPIIDGLVEGCSGLMGKKFSLKSGGASLDNPLVFLEDSYIYLNSYSIIFQHSWMKNEIDEICKILAIGLYKLKFVK